jgi:hypothetical protein
MKKSTLTLAMSLIVGLSAATPSLAAGSNGGNNQRIQTPTLSAQDSAELTYMREEEKLARDTYLTLSDYWYARSGNLPVVTVMQNIAQAEQKHMDQVEATLDRYGLPDPVVDENQLGGFVNPDLAALYNELLTRGQKSPQDALLVGGLIEEVDIQDLKEAMQQTQLADLDRVYESLMCGSRNHLRAFASQVAVTQGTYIAQVLPQTEVNAIITSPHERCGGR